MLQDFHHDKKYKNHKGEYNCPLKLALDTIGGKWKILIIANLFSRPSIRFSEFKDYLTTITDKMLISSLRELEEDGLVNRKVHQVVPPKVEYSLTEHGRQFSSLITEMQSLGELYKVES